MNYTIGKPIGDRVLIKPIAKETSKGGFDLLEGDQKQDPIGTVISVGPGRVDERNILVLILRLLIYFVRRWLDLRHRSFTDNERQDSSDIAQFEPKAYMPVKPGDVVMYGQYAGTKLMFNNEPHIMMRQDDIMMILGINHLNNNTYE